MIKEQGNFVRECADYGYGRSDYGRDSTRSKANAGLATGIIGTVLGGIAVASLWNRNGGGIGNLLSSGSSGAPTNVNINGGGVGVGCFAPTAFEAYQHECEDVLALTSALYNQRIASLQEATAARNTDIAEKFGLYKSQVDADFGLYVSTRNNIDSVNNRINNELFSLYKYTRDKDDETNARLAKLESAVAVNSAVRPYQDKLIQCEIDKAYNASINYTERKTCKMITGQVVIPNTPVVTGFGGYCCCGSNAAAAGA